MLTRTAIVKSDKFIVETVEIPPVGDTTLLVRMLYSSVCDHMSDSIIRGSTFSTDEGVGVVVEHGRETIGFHKDDRVVISRALHGALCTNLFSEYVIVDQCMVSHVSPKISNIEACILGCSVISGYAAVSHILNPRPLSKYLVIGCNGTGLGALLTLNAYGATNVDVADASVYKIAYADRCNCGARIVSSCTSLDRKAKVIAPYGYDMVVLCDTGTASLHEAIRCVSSRGVCLVLDPNIKDVLLESAIEPLNGKSVIFCSGNDIAPDDIISSSTMCSIGQLPLYRCICNELFDLSHLNELVSIVKEGVGGKLIVKCS